MSEPSFDVAVIGGGVVGCAMARRFTLAGVRVVLLEKAADILAGASKANSAILHTAFDAPVGSLERQCMQAGYAEYMEIRGRMNLPLLETGAIVAAWREEEVARLPDIRQQALDNGVDDVEILDGAALRRREPHLSDKVLAGLLVPREHLIDPWSAPLAYLKQAVSNGAQVRFKAQVTGGRQEEGGWRLQTDSGPIQARTVINCAGLYGDAVDLACLGDCDFAIHPRKGQFVVFDKAAAAYLSSILLPVPTARTKGVVLTRTVFGNLLVGPTAEEQDDREHATVEKETLQQLIDKAVEMLPVLAGMPVTAIYAGLRPATQFKEYRIRNLSERSWITVGGIRSTGLTAALGIAQHVFGLYRDWGGAALAPIAEPACEAVPNLAEHLPRAWMDPGRSDIVCHCERVTRSEIEEALRGALPAGDIGGLKRRTRACMGRCQGFNCSAAVAVMTEGRFDPPLTRGVAK